jgi:uridine kinase
METTQPQDYSGAVEAILAKRAKILPERSLLVGVSGIDGSGKGYVTGKIVARLQDHGLRAVGINADGWLNLPHLRFNSVNPAEHFYEHCIRFEEMFAQLILPLRENRSHCVVAQFVEETATEYREHTYAFEEIDILLLEGIFLLKPAYRDHFDLSFWVECTFATALERALQRGQEGLPPEETIHAYETIYFPAQRIHLERDNPRAAATAILINDPRLHSGLRCETEGG